MNVSPAGTPARAPTTSSTGRCSPRRAGQAGQPQPGRPVRRRLRPRRPARRGGPTGHGCCAWPAASTRWPRPLRGAAGHGVPARLLPGHPVEERHALGRRRDRAGRRAAGVAGRGCARTWPPRRGGRGRTSPRDRRRHLQPLRHRCGGRGRTAPGDAAGGAVVSGRSRRGSCATWPRSSRGPGPGQGRPVRAAPCWAPPTRRRTRSACTSPTPCTGSTAGRRVPSFAQQQLNFALGANAWGASFVVGAGTVFPHCMQSEIANLAGSLTGRGDIQLGAVRTGRAARTTSWAWARSTGCVPAAPGLSRRSTPRPPPMRTTWCPGHR